MRGRLNLFLAAWAAASTAGAAWLGMDLHNRRQEISALTQQVDELQNGSDRRLAAARHQIEQHQFATALGELAVLVEMHPQMAANPEVERLRKQAHDAIAEQQRLAEEAEARRREEEWKAAEQKRIAEESQGLAVWGNETKDRLPADFQATDAKNLFRMLTGMKPRAKDEYETDTDYRRRVRQAVEGSRLGRYEATSVFVFQDEDDRILPPVKYDPERRRLYVALEKNITLLSVLTGAGGYVGQNSFGVAKAVDKTDYETWMLVLSNYDSIKRGKHEAPSTFSWKNYADLVLRVEPEEARSLKEKLRVLYLAKLVYPFAETDYDRKSPTIGEPKEVNYTFHRIFANVSEMMLYRTDTGEILARTQLER